MEYTISLSFEGEKLAKTFDRTRISFQEMPLLAEVGDFIQLAQIAEEEQWSGKVLRRTFCYSTAGIHVFYDLEKR